MGLIQRQTRGALDADRDILLRVAIREEFFNGKRSPVDRPYQGIGEYAGCILTLFLEWNRNGGAAASNEDVVTQALGSQLVTALGKLGDLEIAGKHIVEHPETTRGRERKVREVLADEVSVRSGRCANDFLGHRDVVFLERWRRKALFGQGLPASADVRDPQTDGIHFDG